MQRAQKDRDDGISPEGIEGTVVNSIPKGEVVGGLDVISKNGAVFGDAEGDWVLYMDGFVVEKKVGASDGKPVGDTSLKFEEGKDVFRRVGLEI